MTNIWRKEFCESKSQFIVIHPSSSALHTSFLHVKSEVQSNSLHLRALNVTLKAKMGKKTIFALSRDFRTCIGSWTWKGATNLYSSLIKGYYLRKFSSTRTEKRKMIDRFKTTLGLATGALCRSNSDPLSTSLPFYIELRHEEDEEKVW